MQLASWALMASSSRVSSRREADTDGPRTFEAMMTWPETYVQQMIAEKHLKEAFEKYAANAEIVLLTDYSGKGCAEMTVGLLKLALEN